MDVHRPRRPLPSPWAGHARSSASGMCWPLFAELLGRVTAAEAASPHDLKVSLVVDAAVDLYESDDPGVAQRMSAAGTGGCHTLTVSSLSRCIFAGDRGAWSTTRPSTGIGYSVSLTAMTRRCSLAAISRHTL